MPAGSAASLPVSQRLLSPSSFARGQRARHVPPEPRPRPLAKASLLQTAADDPPRRHVLVAWNDTEATLQLQRLLRELDYRVVGPAASRAEAERLIASPGVVRSLDCALVHIGLLDAPRLADRLIEQALPLVWLLPSCDPVLPAAHPHAPILERPFDRAALAAAIDEADRSCRSGRLYATLPPQPVWPRVFPQM